MRVSAGVMRAVVVEEFGPPERLRIAERPVPVPGDGEVSIDVEYAGVGFVDTLLRAGVFPLARPFVPGIEVTGRVRAVGPASPGCNRASWWLRCSTTLDVPSGSEATRRWRSLTMP